MRAHRRRLALLGAGLLLGCLLNLDAYRCGADPVALLFGALCLTAAVMCLGEALFPSGKPS